MPAHRPPRVALIIETSVSYGRSLLTGVARYLRSHHPWSVYVEQHELGAQPQAWLESSRWDGVLCRPTNPELAKKFLRMKVPVVDLNDAHDDLGLPWVGSDHAAIGRLGAKHFLERGFRHFAFCGFRAELWSTKRGSGFAAAVEAEGFSTEMYASPWRGPDAPRWDREIDRIGQWLKQLPKPVAVMACNDVRGLHVLDACHRTETLVPEDAAVIGVDDEAILCNFCNPPLSSVAPDPERIGYEAAKQLGMIMAGRPTTQARTLIKPVGVVTRHSSDVFAVEDRYIAAAARFIRERALHGCRVEDVLKRVQVSRSFLERGFRKYLKRSPQEEIRAVQISRVKQLLKETDFTLARIADLSGFEHPEYMSVLFKRVTGLTPGKFRRHPGLQLGK